MSNVTSFDLYLKQIGSFPLMTEQEEKEVAKRAAEGCEFAQQELVERNLRLCVDVAKKYANRGVDLDDLVQEGSRGLMIAAERFDYTKGNRFSTFAYWWIRQGITRVIADHGRTIRLPVHMVEKVNRVLRAQRDLMTTLEREPQPEDIALHLGMDVKKVKDTLHSAQAPVSIDFNVSDEEDTKFAEFLEDPNIPSPTYEVDQLNLRSLIDETLMTLSIRDEGVIRARYGLDGQKPMTLEQIGQMFGVTRERVRQIESRAFEKLKNPERVKHLLPYYEELG